MIIALCGWPKAGKTSVAEILEREHKAIVVDDGAILRRAACELYGLTWDDVTTQEGKARTLVIGGKQWTVRQLLGDLGNMLEAKYGEQVIPELALRRLAANGYDVLDPERLYVFPSVRKTQGITYQAHGGIVVEVYRPGFGDSGNDFDRYDTSLTHFTLVNDRGLEELKQDVADLLFDIQVGFHRDVLA